MNKDNIIVVKISKDFTDSPGARYRTDGDNSGQEFFEDILEPKLDSVLLDPNKKLLLDIDDTYGYASSFLSEVFIRVVVKYKDKELIRKKIIVKSDDEPLLKKYINQIIDETELE